MLSTLCNSRIQGKFRYSFWNEVYEAVLSPYILVPTIMALINPRLGTFNVTAKGGMVPKILFRLENRPALPGAALLECSGPDFRGASVSLEWHDHPGTIAMNAFWTLFNMIIVGTANAVAFESRQLRTDVRIDMHMPVEVRLPDGRSVFGESVNMSLGGASIELEEAPGSTAGFQGAGRFILCAGRRRVSLPLLFAGTTRTCALSTRNSRLRKKSF